MSAKQRPVEDATGDVTPDTEDAVVASAVEGEAVVVKGKSQPQDGQKAKQRPRKAVVIGVAAVVAMLGVMGWLGTRVYRSHQVDLDRAAFLQVGRQGALNLTTIDYEHADADIQRVLDSSTGGFYDDFKARSKAFIEVVQKAQAKSVGTVTEAGVESMSADGAAVLVGVNVETTNLGSKEKAPRAWRMRISVDRIGNEVKVSDVAFVP